jgi:hypothetical protein
MGYAEGTNIIFVSTGIGNYMFDLESMQIKNIRKGRTLKDVLPYMSFYIPGTLYDLDPCMNICRCHFTQHSNRLMSVFRVA